MAELVGVDDPLEHLARVDRDRLWALADGANRRAGLAGEGVDHHHDGVRVAGRRQGHVAARVVDHFAPSEVVPVVDAPLQGPRGLAIDLEREMLRVSRLRRRPGRSGGGPPPIEGGGGGGEGRDQESRQQDQGTISCESPHRP